MPKSSCAYKKNECKPSTLKFTIVWDRGCSFSNGLYSALSTLVRVIDCVCRLHYQGSWLAGCLFEEAGALSLLSQGIYKKFSQAAGLKCYNLDRNIPPQDFHHVTITWFFVGRNVMHDLARDLVYLHNISPHKKSRDSHVIKILEWNVFLHACRQWGIVGCFIH